VIWDLAGNVTEHVNKANTIDGSGFNAGQTSIAGSSSLTNWDDDGVYAPADMQKYGAATGVGKAQGMGNVHYSQGVANNIFLRGGNSSYGSLAGIFSLLLYRPASEKDHRLGFRCAK